MEIDVGDRLGALPDSIIHSIFSFLETRQFVQTSILSNRWRHLWASTPYLNFHHQFYPSHKFTFQQSSSSEFESKGNGFTDLVYRVLILREVFGIHEFHLSCDDTLDAGHLYTWLLGALRQHAQVISLELCLDRPLDLPSHLFTSRVSTLEIYNTFFEIPIRMPMPMCTATRLKSLELRGVELPDGNLNGELILMCPVLENLDLTECDHTHLKLLTISCVSLKNLSLNAQYWERLESCALHICCPNLTSFKLSACMYTNCSLMNLSSLDITLVNTCGDSRMSKEAYADCLVKVLQGISNVTRLMLSTPALETIADSPSMLELFPSLFLNLRCMELIDWTHPICVEDIAGFLERLSHMETFVWSRSSKMKIGGSMVGGDIQMNSTLKTIKIQDCLWSEDEVKLLEILLQKSTVLEQIIIKKSESLALDIVGQAEFHEKLFKLPRASPNVQISFI